MRPLPVYVPLSRLRGALAGVLLVAALSCTTVLAACSATSDGAPATSGDASPSPAPSPAPQITAGEPPAAAVEVVERFWTLLGEGRLDEAQRTLVAPGAPLLEWTEPGIAAARFVGVAPQPVLPDPGEHATVRFLVTVWIEGTGGATPWGDPADHDLFQSVVYMPDGTWKMWDSATGP